MPLAHRAEYLAFMTGKGLGLLKDHGFRPAGPWVVEVGRWSEVTYLFRFESLAERERLIARFLRDRRCARPTARRSANSPRRSRPASWSPHRSRKRRPPPTLLRSRCRPESVPHRDQLAPGVHVAGFSDRHHSANCGWVALGEETLLIDLPRGILRGRIPGPRHGLHRQARPDAGADAHPGGRSPHSPLPPRAGDHPRSDLARDPRPTARGPRGRRCLRRLDRAAHSPTARRSAMPQCRLTSFRSTRSRRRAAGRSSAGPGRALRRPSGRQRPARRVDRP